MTFKIFFTANDKEDFFIINGETVFDIRLKANEELLRRKLDVEKNNVYSMPT